MNVCVNGEWWDGMGNIKWLPYGIKVEKKRMRENKLS